MADKEKRQKKREKREQLKYIVENVSRLSHNDKIFIGNLLITDVGKENAVDTSSGCRIVITKLNRETMTDIVTYMKDKLQ